MSRGIDSTAGEWTDARCQLSNEVIQHVFYKFMDFSSLVEEHRLSNGSRIQV
jgi:hypothetical protein